MKKKTTKEIFDGAIDNYPSKSFIQSLNEENKTKNSAYTETSGIKVIFKNTYIGKLGIYYSGKEYILPVEIFKLLNIDCKEVK